MPPASEAPPPPKINASRRIINLLKKGPQMTTAIIAATGQRKTTALTMLHRMLDAGKVVRIGTMVFDGKQSRAVWWKLAEPK
jgi:ABC-type phosphate transport system ATPase subunit